MKIAAYMNSSDGSGARRAFYEFVKGLSRSNHALDLYHLSGAPIEKFPIKDHVRKTYTYDLNRFIPWKIRPYLLAESVSLIRKIFFLGKLKRVSRKMAEDMNKRGYDIVFADACTYLRIPYHIRWVNVPSLVYHHRPRRDAFEPLEFVEPGFAYRGPSAAKKIYKKISGIVFRLNAMLFGCIGNINIRHADLVLTNSHYMREFIYKTPGVLSKVVYPGVDCASFKDLGLKKKNYVLSVGGIEESKCFHDIITALAFVPENIRPDLMIISSRTRPKVHRELIRLAQEKKVTLSVLEHIYGEELVRYYNEAYAVVFVPLMEPLGLVPLESMACGTPVIGIREGGVRETVIHEKTGLLVDRGDQELAGAIIRLTEDKELYARLSGNCRDYILENWTWEKSVSRLEKHFQNLIQHKSRN